LLVSQLSKLYGYIPEIECVHVEPCHKGNNGIWDILGYYESVPKLIHICEPEIHKCVDDIKKIRLREFGRLEDDMSSIVLESSVRELVRLHEHCHALLHTCSFKGFTAPNHKWYSSLSPDICEPLVEFISRVLVEFVNNNILKRIFDFIDNKAPPYYKRWIELMNIFIKRNLKDPSGYIPGIVSVLREEGKLKNFEHAKKVIEERWEDINAMSIAFNLSMFKD